jgi:hypothetical protein
MVFGAVNTPDMKTEHKYVHTYLHKDSFGSS